MFKNNLYKMEATLVNTPIKAEIMSEEDKILLRKERKRIAAKKWRDNNQERLKEYNNNYYDTHTEIIKQQAREYHKKNREILNERMLPRSKAYYRDNKDEILARQLFRQRLGIERKPINGKVKSQNMMLVFEGDNCMDIVNKNNLKRVVDRFVFVDENFKTFDDVLETIKFEIRTSFQFGNKYIFMFNRGTELIYYVNTSVKSFIKENRDLVDNIKFVHFGAGENPEDFHIHAFPNITYELLDNKLYDRRYWLSKSITEINEPVKLK